METLDHFPHRMPTSCPRSINDKTNSGSLTKHVSFGKQLYFIVMSDISYNSKMMWQTRHKEWLLKCRRLRFKDRLYTPEIYVQQSTVFKLTKPVLSVVWHWNPSSSRQWKNVYMSGSLFLFINEFAVEVFRKLDCLQEIPPLVVTRSSNFGNLLTFLSTLSMSVGQEQIVRSFLLNRFMLY